MFKGVIDGGCERCSHSDAVVSAESRAVCADPFAVNHSRNRTVGKVEVLVVRLAYHVHVALHDNGRGVFMAGCSRFGDDHVANLVCLCCQIVLFGKFKKVFTDFFFLLGRPGDFGDLIEDRENLTRLKIFDFHIEIFKDLWT